MSHSKNSISTKTITEIISYCNRDLIPDDPFSAPVTYQSEWFMQYFSFLNNPALETHLGDAFYQARFMYKLMSALRLPLAKQKGIVKFQIVQYASICEAILDTAITSYFKNDAEKAFAVSEYKKSSNAVSKATKITYEGTELSLCKLETKKGILKRTRIDKKTEFAVSKGLFSQATKDAVDSLYDLRNNIHILKAADSQYTPKLREAKEAFLLMRNFISEIKTYYFAHPLSD